MSPGAPSTMTVLLHFVLVAPASANDLFLDRAILPADAADLQRSVGRPSISSAAANETVGPTCLEDMVKGMEFHGDTFSDPHAPVEWYDAAKVARGNQVFKNHIGTIGVTYMFALVVGLCYENFLDVLIFTNMSDTTAKDIVRYGDTAKYLSVWCTGDPMNPNSSAFQSVQDVRTYHEAVRKRIEPVMKPIETEWMTQYDMGIVQTAFLSPVFAPSQTLGITFTDEEQDDFIYLWRVIGRQLGIDDRFNIATLGQTAVQTITDEVFRQIIMPSLANPPAEYNEYAGAFVGVMNLACLGFPCFTVPSIVGTALVAGGEPMPTTLSKLDQLRVKIFIFFARILALPYVEPLIGSFFMSLIGRVEPPVIPDSVGNPLLHAASACPSLARRVPDLLAAHSKACADLPAGHPEPEWCSSPPTDHAAHLEGGLPVGTKLLLMAPAATALTMITAATAVLAFGARSLFA